jgi:hypothetical protein
VEKGVISWVWEWGQEGGGWYLFIVFLVVDCVHVFRQIAARKWIPEWSSFFVQIIARYSFSSKDVP